ncbi:MAG: two-component sensor histidine kinase, partial [Bacteroidetes bacterium]|nr:two-component sensor histidine kinase [Bacteroidota bacterium]
MSLAALNTSKLLADLYGKSNTDSAYHYQRISIRLNDSLFGINKFNRIQHILSDEQQRQEKLVQEQQNLSNRYRLIIGVFILLFLLTIAFFMWINYRAQRKKNVLLNDQNMQIINQRDQLQTTLKQLKATQNQLIQAEKMASLGELTAGIAHEIQNPLNFVNNFSDVNREMLEELKAESKKPKAERDEQLEAELINDLIKNEQKINHHGKRADAIVKGMLQHSRASSGQKEPTDINSLADEYLRLAYHGLRAKDKSFNADLITRFDKDLPKVNVMAQDIGRVILNIINNAFYATQEKAKLAGADYKPTVEVSTAQQNGSVVI